MVMVEVMVLRVMMVYDGFVVTVSGEDKGRDDNKGFADEKSDANGVDFYDGDNDHNVKSSI